MATVAPVTVPRVLTATNADVLAASPLEAAPDDGEFQVYMASTQNDTTLTVRRGSEQLIDARAVPQRTNGMVLQSDDLALAIIPVDRNDRLLVAATVVTAATYQLITVFVPA
jgi:hypothetical protein